MRTCIEIISENLYNNLNFFKQHSMSYASVLKSNAYGHGSDILLSVIENDLYNKFSAFVYLEEVKNICSKKPILILCPLYDDYDTLIHLLKNKNIHLSIYDFNSLNHAINIQKHVSYPICFHLKIDTGMHRFGFFIDELEKVCQSAIENNIFIYAIYTHFLQSNIYQTDSIEKQKTLYNQAVLIIKKYYPSIMLHLESSGAITNMVNHIVRTGSLLYGLYKSKEQEKRFLEKFNYPLKQILRWKTKLIHIKSVKKGSSVGYGSNYIAKKDMIIGICPVGYEDGYNVSLEKGFVVINGCYARVYAVIAMNNIIIDLTEIKDFYLNQEVLLIDPDYSLITLEYIASLCNTTAICFAAQLNTNIPRSLV